MEKKFSGYRIIPMAAVFMFCAMGMLGIWGIPLASYFPDYYGVNLVALSFGTSTILIVAFVSSLFAGKLIEKVKPRTLFLAGAVVVLLIGIFYAASHSIVFYYIVKAVEGTICGLFTHNLVTSIVVKWFYDKRAQMIGIVLGVGSFGTASYQFLMGQLLPRLDVAGSFLALAVPSAIIMAICALFMRAPEEVGEKALGHEHDPANLGIESEVNPEELKAELKKQSKALYANPGFWILLVGIFFLSRAVCSIGDYGTGFLPQIGFEFTTAATTVSLMNAAYAAFTLFLLGPIIKKIGSRKMGYLICICAAIADLCALALVYTGKNWGLLVAIVVMYMIGQTTQPYVNIMSADVFGTKMAAAANSKFNAVLLGVGIITYPIWAVVIESGGYGMLWIITFAIAVISLILLIPAFMALKKKGMNVI